MTTTGSTWSPSTTVEPLAEPLAESLHVYTRMPRIYVQGYVQRRASAFELQHHTTCRVCPVWASCHSSARSQQQCWQRKRGGRCPSDRSCALSPRMLLDRKLQARRSFQSSRQQILHSSPVAIAWSISMGHEVLARDDRQACVQRYRRMTTPRPWTPLPCPGRSQFVPCSSRTVSGFANLQAKSFTLQLSR
jgi:hypothetical protein